jgi:hypothetical protein
VDWIHVDREMVQRRALVDTEYPDQLSEVALHMKDFVP